MRRVLLTDTLPEVLEDYRSALGSHFQIFTCHKAEKLMDMIEDIAPDLMVLDLSLPGLDHAALERLLSGKDIPIFATVLYYDAQAEEYAERIGACWVYTKPVQPHAVAAWLLEYELRLDKVPDMALRANIYGLLLQLCATLTSGGFWALAEGIFYMCMHGNCSITDELYPHVARVCGGTAGSVEIAMRRTIAQAFRHSAPAQWRYYVKTSPADKCPSNSRFIKQVAFMIRKSMETGILL